MILTVLGCWSIADSFGIDTKRIEEVNKRTWGFAEFVRPCMYKLHVRHILTSYTNV
jgi:hypothetical protein